MTYAEDVGRRLRAVRVRSGMTIYDVADSAGFTAGAIGAWERGSRGCRVEYLARLAAVYGVTVHDLLPDTRIRWGIDVGVAS